MSNKDDKSDVADAIESEFSRLVDVTTIGAKGKYYKIHTTPQENQALAIRYSVLRVDSLSAECKITPIKRGEFEFAVTFKANLTQNCGVSLEPIAEKIANEFSIILLQKPRKIRDNQDNDDFEFDEEDCELLRSNQVDMGEIIAQHLSLEINPYPRKKGVTGRELGHEIISEEDVTIEDKKKNPFDILKTLKH